MIMTTNRRKDIIWIMEEELTLKNEKGSWESDTYKKWIINKTSSNGLILRSRKKSTSNVLA